MVILEIPQAVSVVSCFFLFRDVHGVPWAVPEEDEEKKAATDLQRLWAWRKPNCRLLPHVCQCRGFMFICYEQGWIYDGSFISFILLY